MKNKILLAELYPEIAREWHPTLNKDITFNDFSAGSHKKAWWLGACGHEWDMIVRSRTSKRPVGCPYCAGRRVLSGFNDLATTHPNLASQWHPNKNGTLTPQMITSTSTEKIWWRGKCGHEWLSAIYNRAKGSGCLVCNGQQVLIGFNDLSTTRPDIATQWHPSKNGTLLPTHITKGANKRVWWQCSQGHEWQTSVPNRVKGDSCPICSGKSVLAGYNDLSTTHPQLASEWHPTLNRELRPEMVSRGSSKKVWWLCVRGHKWDAVVYTRAGKRPQGCPFCSGKRCWRGFNDLATTHPHLAAEWHPTLNGELMPDTITATGKNNFWWQDKLGHEWLARMDHRVNGAKCPICRGRKVLSGYNDLTTLKPKLAAEWHPTLNGDLTPEKITAGSHEKAWWLGECSHEWYASIDNRVTKNSGCPTCAGQVILLGFNDLATTWPDLASEWHPTLNGDLTAEMVSRGNGRKVWWQCAKDHEWQATISDRTRADNKNSNCPQCWAKTFISRGEQEIADYLTNELGLSIEQSNRSLLKGNEIDIYVPDKKLAIEYNGLYWHSTARGKRDRRHLEKYKLAQAAGIQLLQIWEDEWQNKPELVKRLLAHKLGESREPLVGARQTRVEAIPLAEARIFLNEYHIQGHTNGSYYLGLRSKTSQLVALMVLVKRTNPTGATLEIVRYATSHRVPGGFTKLLKHVEATLQPSRLVTFADHCISDGGLYAQNGFTAEKELKPDYRYLVQGQRAHKFGYRLARFKSDPSLLWEPNLTETQLAALNSLHRVYDAGKTRWVKNLVL